VAEIAILAQKVSAVVHPDILALQLAHHRLQRSNRRKAAQGTMWLVMVRRASLGGTLRCSLVSVCVGCAKRSAAHRVLLEF